MLCAYPNINEPITQIEHIQLFIIITGHYSDHTGIECKKVFIIFKLGLV
jgi:hypothetical protein